MQTFRVIVTFMGFVLFFTFMLFRFVMSYRYKEVLLVYGGRKKPVRFEAAEDPVREHENLYRAAHAAFTDVLTLAEGSSTSTHNSDFYLEFKSEEWGGEIVDVSGSITVPTKSTVYLRPKQAGPQETDHVRLVATVESLKFHELHYMLRL